MIDEWCAAAPGRYIPATLIPCGTCSGSQGDPALRRQGHPGRHLLGEPDKLIYKGEPLPSIHDAGRYWDPLFAALQDAGIPLLMHYGSSSNMQLTSKRRPVPDFADHQQLHAAHLDHGSTGSSAGCWAASQAAGLHVGVADRLGGPAARAGGVRAKDSGTDWNNRHDPVPGTLADHQRGIRIIDA